VCQGESTESYVSQKVSLLIFPRCRRCYDSVLQKKDTRPFWFIVLGATPPPFSVSQDYIVLPLVLRLDLN